MSEVDATVLIPVKRFVEAKQRLQPTLDPASRAALARQMATKVVQAAHPAPVAVVCDDDAVRSWAEALDLQVIWTPNLGLNGAVSAGVDQLAAQGVRYVIVTHADLPLATPGCFDRLGPWPGVTLVPDRRGSGTNVIGLDPAIGFTFAFGPSSFRRHCTEAARLRRGLRIFHSEQLGWDLDYPEDLVGLPEIDRDALVNQQIGTRPCASA